jgi:tetratricopeptide (TPR) repeat protein
MNNKMRLAIIFTLPTLVVLTLGGCHSRSRRPGPGPAPQLPDTCRLALVPHEGNEPIDIEIRRLQDQARKPGGPAQAIEKLGWKFVQKSRVSSDPGYYKLAESCALCMESQTPNSPDALLLHGHVLDSLHQFKQAEELARQLITARGIAVDYELLGDAVMEQGRLSEAVDAYQRMMDLKPSPEAYERAAYLRWLKGDLPGAIEMMSMAAQAASPVDPEGAAWAYSRLALYELQAGSVQQAEREAESALLFQNEYPLALLVKSRVLLAEGRAGEAVEPLRRAARLNPLPEYLWVFADALRATGQAQEASQVEADLDRKGAVSDPRTFSLYLASRREQIETSVRLAEQEMETRRDVFTLDALAWSQAAAGRLPEASSNITKALAEGTQDARLFYHAGSIARLAGRKSDARRWFVQASAIKQMLLPSEREELAQQLAIL